MTSKAAMQIAMSAPAVDLEQTETSLNGVGDLRCDENTLVTETAKDSAGRFAVHSSSFVRVIEHNQKKKRLTFGEFTASVYDTCGKQNSGWIVCLAVIAQLIEFKNPERYSISGRFRKDQRRSGPR